MERCTIYLLVISLVIFVSHCQITSPDTEAKLTAAFALSDNGTVEGLQCRGIKGEGSGCYECYVCDREPLLSRIAVKRETKIQRFNLTGDQCQSVDLCCIQQTDLVFRSKHDCGASNPDGEPRARRKTVRSVLQGEYPWRAWIYSKSNKEEPLCAASFVSEESFILLTAASCVGSHSADDLLVAFFEGQVTYARVKSLISHPDFDRETYQNDIAALALFSRESVPHWVKPVCLPVRPAPHGISCELVSNTNMNVHAVIPIVKKDVHPSLLHSGVSFNERHYPQKGGGLFCLEEDAPNPTYIMYGIMLYQDHKTAALVQTNVTHFEKWIEERCKEHLKPSESRNRYN